ncbi:BNI1 (YNL271C) [Zygosaccharomyces parabailii]|nr:BNI1 (YNL271C) [Zygosaccharomyces parabailii]CDH09768.1 related to BNI1-Regulator of budding [Zygosaccharomyces bailii ISA1307]
MIRSSGSRNPNSHHNSNPSTGSSGSSSLIQGLKRLANPQSNSSPPHQRIETGDISSPKQVSVPSRVSNASDLLPLQHSRTPSQQSQSKYTYSRRASAVSQQQQQYQQQQYQQQLQQQQQQQQPQYQQQSHYQHLQHQHQQQYQYQHQTSLGPTGGPISRQPTNHSHATSQSSTASILSQGSLSNLSKFMRPDGKIRLEMPQDRNEIEALFEDILYKRNIVQTLSPEKQQVLRNYDIEKKWLIVKQDLQTDLKKMMSKNSVASSHASVDSTVLSPTTLATSGAAHEMVDSSSGVSVSGMKVPMKSSASSKTLNSSSSSISTQQASIKPPSTASSAEKTNRPPIYYVKKIIADELSTDETNDLWVTLRTEQLDWVDAFLEHQGHIAMANVLMKSLYKVSQDQTLTDRALEREASYFKCFRVLVMLAQGLYEFTKHSIMAETVAYALFSIRLPTRKMATEIFVCMLEKKNKMRFEVILNALDRKFMIGENLHMMQYVGNSPQNFVHLKRDSQLKIVQAWLTSIESTLQGRGKMGSLVGASEEFRAPGGENSILEYSQWTMVFINHLCMGTDVINQRVLLRTRLENAGALRIMNRFKLLDYDKITTQVEYYENGKLDDINSLLETEGQNSQVNMQDPMMMLQKMWDYCRGTENEKTFTSLVQHIFLSSSKVAEDKGDPSKLAKQLKLMDSLVANVSISTVDEESSMNLAIQRLYDAMQTDEVARRAILESRNLTRELEEIQAERDFLRQKLNSTGDGIVGRLEEELRQRDDILAKNQRVNRHLQSELQELKKKHLLEKHEHEVELRKMLTILNARPDDDSLAKSARFSKPGMDSEKQNSIQKALQDGLQRTRKDLSVDSKRFGITVQPNKRLRMLRMKMEGIEQEARELEMTNFSDHEKKQLQEPIQIKRDDSKKQASVRKLSYLRKQLTDIQKETNDISKFNVEERVREMFNEKRLQALKKLKELETTYKGFGIDFNPDELLESKGVDSSLYEQEIDTQDLKAAQSKMDEMDRITGEMAVLKANLENQKKVQQMQQQQQQQQHKQQSDSSSTESSSEDDEDSTEVRNDTASEFSQRSFGSGAGSFLEALSQKYGSGQNSGTSTSPTQSNFGVVRNNSNHRTSFANRMKKSGNATPYFDELTRKVARAPSLTLSNAASGDEDTLPAASPRIPQSIDDTLPRDKVSSSSPVTSAPPPPPPPPPPPLPDILSDNAITMPKTTEGEASAGPAPPPPPPPPPPPLPSFGKASVKGSSSLPPPPLPPGLDTSGLDSSSPSPPPPPPLFPGQKKMYRSDMPDLLEETATFRDNYPQPHKKLKQLHWEKLDATEDSIWSSGVAEKFAGDLYEKGVLAGLEKAFAAREIKSLASRKKDDLAKISFLTRDISQQFGINLHMYSQMSVHELVIKILKCDRDFLQTPSVIEFLSKSDITEVSINLARNFSPYSTDWDGIRSIEDAKPPEKDPNDLQRADQIYLQLIFNLQSYWSSRMRALKVITTYDKEYQELVSKLRKVDKAVGAVLKSENLRNVFNVILAVGNFMNDTAKRAQGFKLSTLQRLTFIKDSTNSMTFLNYVEKVIRDNYPSFNDFLKELEPVLEVTKISIDQLVNDCRDYSQAVINVERSIEIGNLSDSSKFHPLDKVLIKVLPILPEARKKCDLLDDEVRLSIMEFENLMQKYGEDSGDKFAKNTFFKKFADFVQEYKKAQSQNMKVEEEERVYERHKRMVEEQQKREQTPPRKTSGDGDDDDGDDDRDRRDVMDKLLDQLKNAGPTNSDPSSARKRAVIRKKLLADKDAAVHLISDLESGEDSIVYSPTSPIDETMHSNAESPTLHKSQSSNLDSQTPDKDSPTKKLGSQDTEDEEEISDKAKSLLMELSGNGTPAKRSEALNGHKEKLRARRRRTHVRNESTSSNKLSFLDDETPPITPVEVEFNKENINEQLRQQCLPDYSPQETPGMKNVASVITSSSERDGGHNKEGAKGETKGFSSSIPESSQG